MSPSLLSQLRLARNPFTDRTAEKTNLPKDSLYVLSELQGFVPSETTYLIFGRRGSGKTTIRLLMQEAYARSSAALRSSGSSRGHFMVDLTRPSHLTACLAAYRDRLGISEDAWDAQFSSSWCTGDLVDVLISDATDRLLDLLDEDGEEGQELQGLLLRDRRLARQMLTLAHLYGSRDAGALYRLRNMLLKDGGWRRVALGAAAAGGFAAAGLMLRDPLLEAARDRGLDPDALLHMLPEPVQNHPNLSGGIVAGALAAGGAVWWGRRRQSSLQRARELQAAIRVVKPIPESQLAALLNQIFSVSVSWEATASLGSSAAWLLTPLATLQDSADMIRLVCIGSSPYQKLDLLRQLVQGLGYESLTVFADALDEVALLDPTANPSALKKFAQQVCVNVRQGDIDAAARFFAPQHGLRPAGPLELRAAAHLLPGVSGRSGPQRRQGHQGGTVRPALRQGPGRWPS